MQHLEIIRVKLVDKAITCFLMKQADGRFLTILWNEWLQGYVHGHYDMDEKTAHSDFEARE